MSSPDIKEVARQPEDIQVQLNSSDMSEQFGSMIMQIITEQKMNKQLYGIIKDLRKKLEEK